MEDFYEDPSGSNVSWSLNEPGENDPLAFESDSDDDDDPLGAHSENSVFDFSVNGPIALGDE